MSSNLSALSVKNLYKRCLKKAKFFDNEKGARFLVHNYFKSGTERYDHLEIEKDDEFQFYFFADNAPSTSSSVNFSAQPSTSSSKKPVDENEARMKYLKTLSINLLQNSFFYTPLSVNTSIIPSSSSSSSGISANNNYYQKIARKLFSTKVSSVSNQLRLKFGQEFLHYINEIEKLYFSTKEKKSSGSELISGLNGLINSIPSLTSSHLSSDFELSSHFNNDFSFKLSDEAVEKMKQDFPDLYEKHSEFLTPSALKDYRSSVIKKVLFQYLDTSRGSSSLFQKNYITPNTIFISHPLQTGTRSKSIVLLLNHDDLIGSYGISINKRTNYYLNDAVLGLSKETFSPFFNSNTNKIFFSGGGKRRLQIIQPFKECLGYQSFYLDEQKEKERQIQDIKDHINHVDHSMSDSSSLPIPSDPIANPDINLIREFTSKYNPNSLSSDLNPLDAFRFYVGAYEWMGLSLEVECQKGLWVPLSFPIRTILSVIDLIGSIKFDIYNQPYAPSPPQEGENLSEDEKKVRLLNYSLYSILLNNSKFMKSDDLYNELLRLLGPDYDGLVDLPPSYSFEVVPSLIPRNKEDEEDLDY